MTRATEIPDDPCGRFVAIYEALNAERSWFGNPSSLRFGAMTTIGCPGDPADVAESIRAVDKALKDARSWYRQVPPIARFSIAACLVRDGDTAEAFLEELDRVREMFREADVPRGHVHETLAILIMRSQRDRKPVTEDAVRRLKAVYDEMKKHHRWLTGADDYTACSVLAELGDPEAVVGRSEEIYEALDRAGYSKGNQLQAAANMMAADGAPAHELVTRFRNLADAFRARSLSIHGGDYCDLAVLSYLDHETTNVVDRVLEHREVMKTLSPNPGAEMTFDLAVGITFLDLVQRDRDLEAIHDLKLTAQIQALVQQQQFMLIMIVVVVV